jgi:hypothetical protein
MRARELFEKAQKGADIPQSSREALPPSMVVPDLDPNYEYYRLLVALAGLPDNDHIPLNSVLKDKPLIIPYTQIEHDEVMKILAKMDKNPEHLTKAPSIELPDTHKISPVRVFKDYN